MNKEKIQKLIDVVLDERPDLFVVSLNIDEHNHIEVSVDGDEGVKVKDCVAISRAIEHPLNEEYEESGGVDFSLQVKSVGVGSSLELKRQYFKNQGRKLKIKTLEDKIFEGEMTNVTEENITLQWKSREPKKIGKGKVTVVKSENINFENIKEAKVQITF